MTVMILASLVVGKMVGMALAASVAVALGSPPPEGVGRNEILMCSCISSIGLTVSLFMSGQAFPHHPEFEGQAKMGCELQAGLV